MSLRVIRMKKNNLDDLSFQELNELARKEARQRAKKRLKKEMKQKGKLPT